MNLRGISVKQLVLFICFLGVEYSFATAQQHNRPSVSDSDRPNIIVILRDDAGYADFGGYGSNSKIKNALFGKLVPRGMSTHANYIIRNM